MKQYRAAMIGDGKTTATAFRPDLPPGTNWGAIETDHITRSVSFVCADETLDRLASVQRIDTEPVLEVEPVKAADGKAAGTDTATR